MQPQSKHCLRIDSSNLKKGKGNDKEAAAHIVDTINIYNKS